MIPVPDGMRQFRPTTWDRRFNPLLCKWWYSNVQHDWNAYRAESDDRWACVHEHSFAIPHHRALWRITQSSRRGVVEIGAGTGYWAYLLRLGLRAQGKGLLAFDKNPACDNPYGFTWQWYEGVVQADHTVLKDCPLTDSMTLFMCWPPYNDPKDWPAEALRMFKGTTLAYVGEGVGGCTGGRAFHDELDRNWTCVETVELPTWPTVHDSLQIYKRKGL